MEAESGEMPVCVAQMREEAEAHRIKDERGRWGVGPEAGATALNAAEELSMTGSKEGPSKLLVPFPVWTTQSGRMETS